MTDTEAPSSGPSRVPAPIENTSPDEIPRQASRPSRVKSLRHSMADMLVGTVLADRYRLQKRIGEGAMGWVFLAEHLEIGKKVAVKVLRPSLCKLPEAVRRFRREARSASQIGSRHIVDVTDFGTTPNGAAFYVMEYLHGGEDLAALIKQEGQVPWMRVVSMLKQLCVALQAAHDDGIIHRDVKPANFYRMEFEGNPDFIKVLDFGIARLSSPKDSIVTATGVIMGTPDFMAPEQAQGKHVDARADIYSLGACAYSLLTGRPPFVGANEYDVIYKQLNEDPDPPGQVYPSGGIPSWLDDAVLCAMCKDPEDRFQSMKEFLATLEAAGSQSPTPGRAGPAAEQVPAKRAKPRLPAKRPMPISPLLLVGAAAGCTVIGAVGYYILFHVG
ncbi:MAG: serine/threonine protein kinase [Nannocystaceae bacterium]|nr:serine/threonine protein kinase [Nannocystaceae bacterium]